MNPEDLRGAARLATDGVAGLTDLVEAMHERIARLPGRDGPGGSALDGRTTGITGLVYRSIRGVTRLAGGTVDTLLALLAPALLPGAAVPQALPGAEREALVAALNGVLGDHLAATGNPLAIGMALRHGGQALPLQAPALAAWLQARALPAPATLVVLLHGLCMNDRQWGDAAAEAGPGEAARNADLGSALAGALGALPLYLHANTGLPIAANGRHFAALMAQLQQAWPVPLQRVVLLGHSMGGLIARSALHQAGGSDWAALCSDLVCLGSPHHGAPLEKAGHGIDLLLGATPGLARYTAPLARLGRLRSAGITDLRHGLQDAAGRVLPLPPPPPQGPRCWALAGTLDTQLPATADAASPVGAGARTRARAAFSRLRGDGLVPVASALGRHGTPAQCLAFAPGHSAVLPATGHLALLHSAAVRQQLLAWLAPAPA